MNTSEGAEPLVPLDAEAEMDSLIPGDVLGLLDDLSDCACCPRNCHVDRAAGGLGYCRTGDGFEIGSIVVHRGEEPVISGTMGIGNIFFSHCNMQCVFCQNHQISRNHVHAPKHRLTLNEVVRRVEAIFSEGIRSVGFVSASHCIPQMHAIIGALNQRQPKPVYVFNTNAYDKRETLELLENAIDVYLPDLKYMDADLARRYSDTPGYPRIAAQALREMFRQKGADLRLGGDGLIESGLIIRHLILPGHVENSKRCLRFIAEELSTSVHVSLMAQYYPIPAVNGHPNLGRRLTREEYEEVLDEFYALGFHRGWVQELSSADCWRPDFDRPEVFGP